MTVTGALAWQMDEVVAAAGAATAELGHVGRHRVPLLGTRLADAVRKMPVPADRIGYRAALVRAAGLALAGVAAIDEEEGLALDERGRQQELEGLGA